MAKTRKRRKASRPSKLNLPPRINATPEELAAAMFQLPVDHQWQYMDQNPETAYKCQNCGKEITYPAILDLNGLCTRCTTGKP